MIMAEMVESAFFRQIVGCGSVAELKLPPAISTRRQPRHGAGDKQNVYSRLGVKTVINCRGTWTYLSGSLEFPEVRQAQLEASEYFVNMLELQRAVGRRLSELTGAESGIVTSGSAGAMAAATAACMAGSG